MLMLTTFWAKLWWVAPKFTFLSLSAPTTQTVVEPLGGRGGSKIANGLSSLLCSHQINFSIWQIFSCANSPTATLHKISLQSLSLRQIFGSKQQLDTKTQVQLMLANKRWLWYCNCNLIYLTTSERLYGSNLDPESIIAYCWSWLH